MLDQIAKLRVEEEGLTTSQMAVKNIMAVSKRLLNIVGFFVYIKVFITDLPTSHRHGTLKSPPTLKSFRL